MYVGSGVNVTCTPVCKHVYKSQRKASGTPFIISLIIPLRGHLTEREAYQQTSQPW